MRPYITFCLLGIVMSMMAVACLKDRTFPPIPDNNISPIQVGDLYINELVSGGSNQSNEFGTTEDWFEIYNPSLTDTIFLAAKRWYFSDDLTNTTKYLLRKDTFILPNNFLVIWCDGLDTNATEIHTNFGLSSAGESVSLTYVDDDGLLLVIDTISFTTISSGNSLGREMDGASNWIEFTSPTIGSSNFQDTGTTNPTPSIDTIGPGSLLVNEILAKGSLQANEFGTTEDWFEIYNPSPTDTIFLLANKWEFRDNGNSWTLPVDTLILPQAFLMVWCDGLDQVVTQLHSNFALSSGGDEVRLFHISPSGTTFEVDGYSFGAQLDAISIGRSPDGGANWTSFTNPTPGTSNP